MGLDSMGKKGPPPPAKPPIFSKSSGAKLSGNAGCLKPSFEFTKVFALETSTFVPWEALFEYIPKRVEWWVEEVKRTFPVNRQHLYKIAHSRASAYAPENSLEAFTKGR